MKVVQTLRMFERKSNQEHVSIIIASKPFVCFTGDAFTLSVFPGKKYLHGIYAVECKRWEYLYLILDLQSYKWRGDRISPILAQV